MASGIYKIKIGHKKYVGQAVNIDARWQQHRRQLERGQHHNQELQRYYDRAKAIRRASEEDQGPLARFSVVIHCPRWQLNDLEALWGRVLSNTDQRLPRLRWSSYLPAFCLQTLIDWAWVGVVLAGIYAMVNTRG